MKNEPLRILLVDDHAVVRVGLRNLIEDEPDLCVVGEATLCKEALELAAETEPQVIVLDLRLPDGSGVETIDALKRAAPGARVLVLTSFADDTLLLAALKAGADGYLLKDIAEADLIGSIREVASAGVVMPPPGGARETPGSSVFAVTMSPLEQLTGQERRVFELVGRGHSNREVAEATGLTVTTVRNYLSRVFGKLNLRCRSQLIALYFTTRSRRK
jgi:two-component system, NarL family, response regulator DevR